jgi:ketopantoate hydroxymethyltransferase
LTIGIGASPDCDSQVMVMRRSLELLKPGSSRPAERGKAAAGFAAAATLPEIPRHEK